MKKKYLMLVILFIIIGLLSTLSMPYTRKEKEVNNHEYVQKDIFKDKLNTKIIDIALLGAHDAFSNGIIFESKPNINEGGIVTNSFVNTVARGLMVRMSKAQIASASQMLYSGVRYFDVRVSKVDDEYYSCHGLMSSKLSYYIQEIVDFLKNHPGEFIIFDIQHFYTESGSNYELVKEDYQELYEYISSIKNEDDLSLIDYCNYDTSSPVSFITYGELTRNQTTAGCVILSKNDDFPFSYKRDSDASYNKNTYNSIMSLWHNTNSKKEMIREIEKEYEYLLENDYDVLIVNQAQLTGFIENFKVVKSLFNWSLINMANSFNYELIKDEERFYKWLSKMPIFMVDYVTSNKGDFNNVVNEYIANYNLSL